VHPTTVVAHWLILTIAKVSQFPTQSASTLIVWQVPSNTGPYEILAPVPSAMGVAGTVTSVHVNVQGSPLVTDAVSVSTPSQLVLPATAMLATGAVVFSVTLSELPQPAASVTVPVIVVCVVIGPTVKVWHVSADGPNVCPSLSVNVNGPNEAGLVVHSSTLVVVPQTTEQVS
jgi:hypothetical protein